VSCNSRQHSCNNKSVCRSYRIQEKYLEHLRQQQAFLQNDRYPDYDRDPYFYTAPIYRYHRGDRYYETNQYGADYLRQAVNYGYQEAFRGWTGRPRGSLGFQLLRLL
jgi:hypothetical protein